MVVFYISKGIGLCDSGAHKTTGALEGLILREGDTSRVVCLKLRLLQGWV